MKRILLALLFLFVSTAFYSMARANMDKMVNDNAGLFSASYEYSLEQRLIAFSDSTSNQIAVVTVNDLNGLTAAEYAQQIGQEFGVGTKEHDNGVVILIKPKTKHEGGDVFIATGYGIEGALPDATCKRIIINKMLPYLILEQYEQATTNAVDEITNIMAGEYNDGKHSKEIYYLTLLIIIAIILFIIACCVNFDDNDNDSSSSSFITRAILGGILGSGGSSSGGFGGGSFGGGGAGAHF